MTHVSPRCESGRLTPEQNRERKRIAREYAATGRSFSDLARAFGCSRVAVYIWLARHEMDETHAALKSNGRKGVRCRGDEAERIRLVAEAEMGLRTFRSVARRFGVTDAAISLWRSRNWIAVHEEIYERDAA